MSEEFEIVNFDDICTDKNDRKKKKCIHMPNHPFRMLMIGGSGSGKTNILMNMIVRYLDFDKIFIYTKHLDQDKYKWLQNFFKVWKKTQIFKLLPDLPNCSIQNSHQGHGTFRKVRQD